jgi:hypothetical protein
MSNTPSIKTAILNDLFFEMPQKPHKYAHRPARLDTPATRDTKYFSKSSSTEVKTALLFQQHKEVQDQSPFRTAGISRIPK